MINKRIKPLFIILKIFRFKQIEIHFNWYRQKNFPRKVSNGINSLSIPIHIPGFTELPQGEILMQTQILGDKRDISSLNPKKQAFLDLDQTGFLIKAN